MTSPLNETHDPARRSWVESANSPGTDFPIQNLPFGVVQTTTGPHVVVAIGGQALDLSAVKQSGVLQSIELDACQTGRLNDFMSLGHESWSAFRRTLSDLLGAESQHQAALAKCLIPLSDLVFDLPAVIGDYTDFYTSIHHATNIGRLFRPHNPLLPNYKWVPIGYHGRSSSIGISGEAFHRPSGQLKLPDAEEPFVGPCQRLDYELEVGIFVGAGNESGSPVPIEQAEQHIFGLCLLNDWSARDIQTWEYQPLGPFLAKSFASTISPWIVTTEALAPFRLPFTREAGEPSPLPYLSCDANDQYGAVDMQLEVLLQTQKMRESGLPAERLSKSNFRDAYWTMAQMLAHHTVNGCNLRPGDLFGSGTMSGPGEGSQGALIEITRGGQDPVVLSSGEQRTFLEDGDTVVMRAGCSRDGFIPIGFGEAVGTVLPAR